MVRFRRSEGRVIEKRDATFAEGEKVPKNFDAQMSFFS